MNYITLSVIDWRKNNFLLILQNMYLNNWQDSRKSNAIHHNWEVIIGVVFKIAFLFYFDRFDGREYMMEYNLEPSQFLPFFLSRKKRKVKFALGSRLNGAHFFKVRLTSSSQMRNWSFKAWLKEQLIYRTPLLCQILSYLLLMFVLLLFTTNTCQWIICASYLSNCRQNWSSKSPTTTTTTSTPRITWDD